MKKINIVILMAGKGTRTSLEYNKAFYKVNNIPLFMHSVLKFSKLSSLHKLYLVVSSSEIDEVKDILSNNFIDAVIIEGASERFESVQNAIKQIDHDYDVIIHDAARPLTNIKDVESLIETTDLVGTLYHDVTDTIKDVSSGVSTVNRTMLKAVTTPQYFSKILYNDILLNTKNYTDELQIFENKYNINFVKETSNNLKVTTNDDLDYVSYLINPKNVRVGHSYDFHPFEENRKFILGGVSIPHNKGLKGHSDADALYHAVAESIIGALSIGDIGTLFPDTDMTYKDMDSSYFVKKVMELVKKQNKKIYNIDAIIYIESPKLKNYKTQMANNIKYLTNCTYVNVKATTMEKKGLVGSCEGIGCEVVCTLVDE